MACHRVKSGLAHAKPVGMRVHDGERTLPE